MRVLHVAATLTLVAVATTSILEAASLPAWSRSNRGDQSPAARTEWTAQLQGRDGRKVTGSATAKPGADGKSTDVVVTIDGDTPGATRPWHVHTGSCTQSGGVVGGGRAYSPIVIDARGTGRSTVTVPALLADSATYYVNIHDAASAMNIIVACGDLTKK